MEVACAARSAMSCGRPSNPFATATAGCARKPTALLSGPMRLLQEPTFSSRKDRPQSRPTGLLPRRAACSVRFADPCCSGTMQRNSRIPCSLPLRRWIRPYRRLPSATYMCRRSRRGMKLPTGGRKASSIDHACHTMGPEPALECPGVFADRGRIPRGVRAVPVTGGDPVRSRHEAVRVPGRG